MCLNCGPTYGCEPDCPNGALLKYVDKKLKEQGLVPDPVDHPQHYGGEDDPYEVIKVMIAWDAEMAYHFCVGNAIKYFGRLGKKYPEKQEEDLRKAGWYATKAADIYNEHLSEESESEFVKAIDRHNTQVAKVVNATSPPFGVNLGIRQDGSNDV